MVQFRWIKTSLFVKLVLLFTAVTGQRQPSFMARVGDEVTLPCENAIKNLHQCGSTSWIATLRNGVEARQLVDLGQISKNGIPQAKSDRLSVTAKCSLAVKNVTVEDVGRYSCRQYKSEQQQGQDAQVYLSVINIIEDKNNDMVTLLCSVLTYEGCDYTVKWLYEGNENDTERLQYACSAAVTFPTTHFNQKSNSYELLKCNVTDNKSGQMLLCDASPQSSCKKTGSTSAGGDMTTNDDRTTKQDWWMFVTVAAGLAALMIIIVAVVRWKKTKGNKTQMDENLGKSLNPAVTQSASETSQDMAEPKNGVSYASISYTKKTNSEGQVPGKGGDDEDEAVTYTTVKPSSSSAGASADPSSLYATINKPNKKDVAV